MVNRITDGIELQQIVIKDCKKIKKIKTEEFYKC